MYGVETTQIWTALISMLLLKFLQLKARRNWSLSNLVAMLRWNLFTYRDLWKWLDDPFGVPPGRLPPSSWSCRGRLMDSRRGAWFTKPGYTCPKGRLGRRI